MSDIVKGYYDENAQYEWERLDNPYRKIEFLSTLYLINKYFPKEGMLCDIGCGPGRYSIEMLKKGYDVTLFELSSEELKLAKEKIKSEGLKAEEFICDTALNINRLEDKKFNGMLIMGPMYHLYKKEDRLNVLKEAKKKLTDDGVALISYINSIGTLKAGLTEFYETFEEIENVYNYLGEQVFDETKSFTEVYFTTPEAALRELEEAGFQIISYGGAESFLSGLHLPLKKVYEENRAVYDNFVKVAVEKCELPQYRDATEHLNIVVGIKKEK
ncbi:class I SAM-dependent methyltransferase [Clostridium sp. FP1]|uniref:class I SAM-dependent methyltransferase n=1 Tax=Clostridium sp. FP1 TaxID=2724076 RepID=UPI0013E917E8|nr:class I SAM-dependent methyltransferase [Clostridium sp. FP1]MBZ9635027.1 class I SAM-dependent methyltransferase [Clostridium sp. FP1]